MIEGATTMRDESTTPNASEPEMIRVRYTMRGGQHAMLEPEESVYLAAHDLGDVTEAIPVQTWAKAILTARAWAASDDARVAYVIEGARAYRVERAG